MSWKNIRLVFLREVRDQLRDRRTLFMITILPVLLYPMLGLGIVEMMLTFSEQARVVVVLNADDLPTSPALLDEAGISKEWFEDGEEETSKLRVLAERTAAADDKEKSPRRPRRGEKTDEELLKVAHQLADRESASGNGWMRFVVDRNQNPSQPIFSCEFINKAAFSKGNKQRCSFRSAVDGARDIVVNPSIQTVPLVGSENDQVCRMVLQIRENTVRGTGIRN